MARRPYSQLRRQVERDAGKRCGYCLVPQDPETDRTVRLFNPRSDVWSEHFMWSRDGLRIIGRTAIGRSTVATLRLNHELWLPCRRLWVLRGIWPPRQVTS